MSEAAKVVDVAASPRWTTQSCEGYQLVSVFGKLDMNEAQGFEKETFQSPTFKPSHYVINCEGLSELTVAFAKSLGALATKLKGSEKGLRLYGANPEVVRFIKNQGMQEEIKTVPSLKMALGQLGLDNTKQIDAQFVSPFLEGAVHVLKIQCQTTAKAGKPYKKLPGEKFFGDISGVIGLVSDAFDGSVVISFPKETFLKVMGKMLGETYTELTKEIEDGAGELTNIIFGQAKIKLNEKGYGIRTAIPSVVSGADHSVQQVTKGPRVVIPFDSDSGNFVIEICVSE